MSELALSVGVLVVPVLAAIALVLGFRWGRLAREVPVTPVPQSSPPIGIGPAHLAFADTGTVSSGGLVAVLLHQAERGLTRIVRLDAGRWLIVGHAPGQGWATADPVSWAVAAELRVGAPGATFLVEPKATSGLALARARGAARRVARTWYLGENMAVRTTVLLVGTIAVWVAAIGALFSFVAGAWQVAVPCAAFAVGGAALFDRRRQFQRTEAGNAMAARIEGYKQFLGGPPATGRGTFSATQYLAGLPFAVAFGAVAHWEYRYRLEAGTWPPVVPWFEAFGAPPGHAALHDFERTVALALRSAGSSGSSSGGDGSGGDSGGGDSGGGGGD